MNVFTIAVKLAAKQGVDPRTSRTVVFCAIGCATSTSTVVVAVVVVVVVVVAVVCDGFFNQTLVSNGAFERIIRRI